MSPYALLGLSVLFEVFGDTCMKLSEGFKRKVPIIGIVVGYAVSFYALSHVFADLPLGLAYAVWTSAAVALTAVVSRIIWKEKFNGKKIVVDGVLHEMCLLLLTETEQSVADA